MIITEFYRTKEDGINLYRTYSNQNKIILQQETGYEYEEAIDVENNSYSYIETDKDIITTLQETDEDKIAAFNILMGREQNG